ncbi:MAG: GNAT family N-acetyltransferase [Micrococcales bacterium]|nr:GNAT family N-acetyltransferase [Micrococcales bacterium]
MTSLAWERRFETALTPAELEEITALLQRAFPGHPGGIRRGWSGERPELRLLGRDRGRLVAHIGILRRFIRVRATDAAVLAADVGLVCVDPEQQRGGLGRALMERAAAEFVALGVEFGTLTTGEDRVGFYQAVGWVRAATPVLHAIDLDNAVEGFTGPLMYRAVSGAPWPEGELERNGREI